MNSQNILKYYGSKLDLKLDSSELYDFEIGGVENDYDISLLDFTTSINYNSLIVDSNCLNLTPISNLSPWIINIGEPYTGQTCDFTVRKRTESGWTLDFVFSGNTRANNTFYDWGTTNQSAIVDNYLRFYFVSNGSIAWEVTRYSGYCNTVSGYTETTYVDTDSTSPLPTGQTQSDFNVTITFERYNKYELCDLSNEGGFNDLISGVTILNPTDMITGATEEVSFVEVLNEKWWNERNKRLGVLKIYLNGGLIYKKENWEEVIPSKRAVDAPIFQKFFSSLSNLTIKKIKYFEEPLNFLQINHHYIVDILSNYDVPNNSSICDINADNTLIGYTDIGLLTEISENLLTEDNNILLY
jgi:hypothetical protein